jgi:hypothetical protein
VARAEECGASAGEDLEEEKGDNTRANNNGYCLRIVVVEYSTMVPCRVILIFFLRLAYAWRLAYTHVPMCASCATGLAQMVICASAWCLKTGGRSR